MEIILPIILIIFFSLIFSVGFQRALQILSVLIIFAVLFFFFGWIIINFFWIFVLIWFFKSISGNKSQKTHTRYYRTYTGKEAEEFFKNFYNQAGYSQDNRYQNYNNYNNQGNFNSWVDKDKYYAELGVEKNCSKDELRKAYLKKVKENHPDRFSNINDKKIHEEKLKKINEAYDNLIKDYS